MPAVRTKPVRDIKIVTTKPTERLDSLKKAREFFATGLYEFASATLIDANEDQLKKRPPQNPTAFYADRKRQGLTETEAAKFKKNPDTNVVMIGQYRTWKKIGLFYQGTVDIYKAVVSVYADLLRLTRRQSGLGVGTYYFWCVNKDNRADDARKSTPGGVKLWLDKVQSSRVTIHVLGPTVPYRRKLIYNQKGSPNATKGARALSKRTKGTAIDRIVGFDNAQTRGLRTKVVGKKRPKQVEEFRVKQALQRLVVRRNKAKFRGKAWIAYGYVTSKEALMPDLKTGKKYGQGPGPHGNIPVIYIGGSLKKN